jgi:hypothetical protein
MAIMAVSQAASYTPKESINITTPIIAFLTISGTAVLWHLLWNGRIDINLGNVKIIGKGGKN